jgi:superfamily I DNA/RNA helicase
MSTLRTVFYDPEEGVDQEDWENVVGLTKFLGKKTAEESWNRSPGEPLKNKKAPAACRSANQRRLWDDLIYFLETIPNYASVPLAVRAVVQKLSATWDQRWADDPSKSKEATEVMNAFASWASNFKSIQEVIDESKKIKETTGGVTLSTVHKFKGLERNCIALWKVGFSFPMQHEKADKEEEACIFYVAVTRARHILAMFHDPISLPYGLASGLCPKNYVIPEVLNSKEPEWGAYSACKLCSNQLQCLTLKEGEG